MPALPPELIIKAIEDAFSEASATAILISDKQAHPRRFNIEAGESSFPIWIYIWTLTHGGGEARPRDEYRIQLTSVAPPLPENPNGPTLLIGYEPNIKCFAGFDLRKHKTFSTQSPSIQININNLREAERDGFSFQRKGNDEIAVAFRPDNILAYSMNVEDLHTYGADAYTSSLLEKAARFEAISENELGQIAKERRKIVSKISRLSRDSNFRRKVIVAYDRKCSVTGLQLQLIDAAHILPVGAEGSTDEVNNGICLSPTYHRAYDRGLIYLADDLVMRVNTRKRDELIALGIAGGLPEFESHINRQIFLPPDRKQWPNIEMIRRANSVRER
jgi:putative restriction endonuclease